MQSHMITGDVPERCSYETDINCDQQLFNSLSGRLTCSVKHNQASCLCCTQSDERAAKQMGASTHQILLAVHTEGHNAFDIRWSCSPHKRTAAVDLHQVSKMLIVLCKK